MIDNADLRRWAIEQAIKLHGSNGLTTKSMVEEAKEIMKFAEPEKAEKKPAA